PTKFITPIWARKQPKTEKSTTGKEMIVFFTHISCCSIRQGVVHSAHGSGGSPASMDSGHRIRPSRRDGGPTAAVPCVCRPCVLRLLPSDVGCRWHAPCWPVATSRADATVLCRPLGRSSARIHPARPSVPTPLSAL